MTPVIPESQAECHLRIASTPGLCSACLYLSCTEEPSTGHCSRCALPSAELRGRISPLDVLAALRLMQPRIAASFFAARAQPTQCPPGSLGPFLPICFPSGWSPARTDVWGCSSQGMQDSAFLLAELAEVHSLSEPVSPACQGHSGWQHNCPATTCPKFASSANLLQVHSASPSRPLIKNSNRIGTSTDPQGTLLVTGLQLDSVTDHHALGMAIDTVFSQPHCPLIQPVTEQFVY